MWVGHGLVVRVVHHVLKVAGSNSAIFFCRFWLAVVGFFHSKRDPLWVTVCCVTRQHTLLSELSPGVWISFSRHSPNWLIVRIFTRQVKKQLASSTKIVSEKGKNPHQDCEWVCVFTCQAWIGKLASGYPHPEFRLSQISLSMAMLREMFPIYFQAVKTLHCLCSCCGDFVRQRVEKDVLPSFKSFLEKQATVRYRLLFWPTTPPGALADDKRSGVSVLAFSFQIQYNLWYKDTPGTNWQCPYFRGVLISDCE
jgi:hypothetical protein